MIVTCKATLASASPYSQSKPILDKKPSGEAHDAWEEKTWRQRMHVDKDGEVFIPAQAFKHALSDTAKFVSESVPGKGKATFTKHFEAGVMIYDNAPIGIAADNVEGERLFVPSDGRKGGGSRVWKVFPRIDEWVAEIEVHLFDPIIQAHVDKVREYLEFAGRFIGIGRWRPRNGGQYGRFRVTAFEVFKD